MKKKDKHLLIGAGVVAAMAIWYFRRGKKAHAEPIKIAPVKMPSGDVQTYTVACNFAKTTPELYFGLTSYQEAKTQHQKCVERGQTYGGWGEIISQYRGAERQVTQRPYIV